jgi:hypothetical protein
LTLAASTNYAALVRPLQVLVMVVAGLFFLRVLRVASIQARPADAGTGQSRRRRGGPLALEFIEPIYAGNHLGTGEEISSHAFAMALIATALRLDADTRLLAKASVHKVIVVEDEAAFLLQDHIPSVKFRAVASQPHHLRGLHRVLQPADDLRVFLVVIAGVQDRRHDVLVIDFSPAEQG